MPPRELMRNPRRFLDGYRFGQTLAAPEPTADPPPGRLERFFDANTEGPGIWKWRHYFPIYERHLSRFVGRSPSVVEIGVYSGGSLNMWREYFGSGVSLIGIDIEPMCRTYEREDTRILIGDQADPRFMRTVVDATPGGIDAVLDDGGHEPDQQIGSLKALLPHLRPGGVYVIEDVTSGTNSFHAFIEGLARNLHTEPNGTQAGLAFHLYPFVAVIEKRDGSLGQPVQERRGSEWQAFYDETAAGRVAPLNLQRG